MERNGSGLLLAAIAAILAAASPLALAEKYIEVSRDTFRNHVTLFDVDSPKLNPATKAVEFKYRTVSDSVMGSGTTILEYTAVAWCHQMTMWVVRVDGVGDGYKFPVKEYYKEGRGWTGHAYITVANFSHSDGKLLVAACDAGNPAAMDLFMQPPPDSYCLNPKNAYSETRCSTSSDMRGDMALLEKRIDIVGQKCGNKVWLEKALESKTNLLKPCYGGDKCVWRQLNDIIAAINTDVWGLEMWESSGSPQPFPAGTVCNAETKLRKADIEKQARNAKQEKVSMTTDAFFACAKRNIAKLDDRKSDAAVIAKVVYRPCSKEFYDAEDARKERDGEADSEQLKKNFEDKLLEMVLTNRSAAK
jgi:hypothetical protein